METGKKFFRRAALEKIASPERLDEMLEVTAPAGWLALAGLGLIVFAAVLWGVFGTVSIKVEGRGILLRGETVLAIASATSGRVDEIRVHAGDVVEEGATVATLEQPDLALRIENTEQELAALTEQGLAQDASAERILQQLRTQAEELRRQSAAEERLVREGIVARGKVLQTDSSLASIEQQIAQQEEALANRGNRVEEVRRELDELRSLMATSSAVESPHRGRVLELAAHPGDLVTPGSRLLTLESLEGAIDAVVFVPAADGKRIRPGMAARVSPSTVRAEEYGFILGEVKSASGYPVTPEGMARVLRNQQLVDSLTGAGTTIDVVVQLIEDPSTASGFRWTSSSGPPDQVFTGTICTATVTVERKRPISYVLPILRKTLGVS